MKTKKFWIDATERAVKTAGQFVLGAAGVGATTDVLTLDWSLVGGAALTGAFLSYVTSIATAKIGPSDTPSVVYTGKHRA